MTTDKARKRAVRTRMTKTGERYAAARRHVVAASDGAADAPLPPRMAEPGVSDEAVTAATGKGWDAWFRILDTWGATTHTHTEIARHVHEAHGVPGWWAQSVTVGYERARGMRAVHETTRGFEVSVSKTIPITPADAWPWLIEPARRDRWVEPSAGLTVDATKPTRWIRLRAASDGSVARIYLDAKGEDRAVATVTHEKLAGADAVSAQRTVWRGRLAALAGEIARRGGVSSPDGEDPL